MHDVVRAAGEELGALLGRDDVVRRRDDVREVGHVVAERSEGSNPGHRLDHNPPMRIQAAVLREFGAPLADRGGRARRAEGGRGARPPRRLRGLPHRPLHRIGRRPVGLCADGARPRRRGRRRAGRRRRHVGRPRRPRRHALLAAVPRMRPLPRRADESLPRDPRAAEPGLPPDGTTRLAAGGEPIRHFMGTSTFAEYTVMPEIALAKISPEAPLDRACVFACGLSTGLGAAMNTAKVHGGLDVRRLRRRARRPRRGRGLPAPGRERIIAVDLSADRLELARGQGATDVLAGGPDTVQQILDLTRRVRRRLHVRGDRERRRHAAGGRVRAHGLGPRHRVRRRRQGRDARRRAALPHHRPPRRRLVVRRRQGPRRRAAARRPLARRRARRRSPDLPPAAARRGEPRLRADGGAGRDPQRDRVRRPRLIR